jgi:hypothetical protein
MGVKISNVDKSLKKLIFANDLKTLREKGWLLMIFFQHYGFC